MAAADIISRVKGNGLAMELIEATVSDGETVMSSLTKPLYVIMTASEDTDAELNYTLSGRTITINYASATDKKVAILVFGRL